MASLSLRVVDGLTLPEPVQAALRPNERLADARGQLHRLPRFFYEVPSWEVAQRTQLAPEFKLSELMHVDLFEAEAARTWPRYVPCAVGLVSAHLALLRQAVGTFVHVAANGGYRSPSHSLDRDAEGRAVASPHHWGTAANIYRIGDDWLDDPQTVAPYRERLEALLPAVRTLPYGNGLGYADDHLHLDLGFAVLVPPSAPRLDALSDEA